MLRRRERQDHGVKLHSRLQDARSMSYNGRFIVQKYILLLQLVHAREYLPTCRAKMRSKPQAIQERSGHTGAYATLGKRCTAFALLLHTTIIDLRKASLWQRVSLHTPLLKRKLTHWVHPIDFKSNSVQSA